MQADRLVVELLIHAGVLSQGAGLTSPRPATILAANLEDTMKLAAALLIAAAVTAPAFAADQTQIFNTQAGAVRITPIYHATARIQAGRDTLYIDPAKPAKIDGMTAGDLILVTDIHGDHMDAADITALSKNGTQVIAPAAVQKTITQARVLANGESTRWHDWKITAVPMYNITHNQPNGQPYHAGLVD
jgi:hypothetical protein